jgi:hypothetical protein
MWWTECVSDRLVCRRVASISPNLAKFSNPLIRSFYQRVREWMAQVGLAYLGMYLT